MPGSLVRIISTVFLLSLLTDTAVSQVEFSRSTLVNDVGGHGLSITESPAGPALSFYRSTSGNLAFLSKSDDGYVLEDIVLDAVGLIPDTSSETSLLFHEDIPHIVYRMESTAAVNIAYRTDDGWSIEELHADAGYPEAILCGDKICICVYDAQGGNPVLVEGTPGNWQTETIDTSPENTGMYCDLLQSSGKLIAAYYDADNKLVKVSERSDEGWETRTIMAGEGIAFGFWPDLTETPEGTIELRASVVKASDAGESDGPWFYAKKEPESEWGSAIAVNNSFVGGYPAAVYADGRSFVFFRYLRFSALFGNASFITYTEELEDGTFLSGNLNPGGFCLPSIRYLSTYYGRDRRVYLAFLKETPGCDGAPESSIELYTSSVLPLVDPEPTPTPQPEPDPAPNPEPEPTPDPDPDPLPEPVPAPDVPAEDDGGPSVPDSPDELRDVVNRIISLIDSIKSGDRVSGDVKVMLASLQGQISLTHENDSFSGNVLRQTRSLSKLLNRFNSLIDRGNRTRRYRTKLKSTRKKVKIRSRRINRILARDQS